MNKTKSILLFTVVVAVVFLGVKLSTQGPQAVEAKSLTVTKNWWPASDTLQIGVHQHEKQKRSFQTTFNSIEDYGLIMEKFNKPDVDACTLTIYEAILAVSQGVDIKIVLLLDYTIGSDGVIAKKHIQSVLDLQGKRIGIETGTITHFTVLKALEQAGLDHTEVEFVNLGTKDMVDAFINNEIDAAGTFEPYMSTMAQEGNGHVIFSSKEIPRAICDVLFVKGLVIRQYPEAIDHWINAWNGALAFKHDEPEKHLRSLSELNGTSVSDLKESFGGIFFTDMMENKIAFGTSQEPGYLLESLKEMEDFMVEQGVIPEASNLHDLIYFDGVHKFWEEE